MEELLKWLWKKGCLELAHCNGRMFKTISRSYHIGLPAFGWPDYSYEEKLGCWEEAMPNGGTMKKILFSPKGTSLSRELPENAASSFLKKLI